MNDVYLFFVYIVIRPIFITCCDFIPYDDIIDQNYTEEPQRRIHETIV